MSPLFGGWERPPPLFIDSTAILYPPFVESGGREDKSARGDKCALPNFWGNTALFYTVREAWKKHGTYELSISGSPSSLSQIFPQLQSSVTGLTSYHSLELLVQWNLETGKCLNNLFIHASSEF